MQHNNQVDLWFEGGKDKTGQDPKMKMEIDFLG